MGPATPEQASLHPPPRKGVGAWLGLTRSGRRSDGSAESDRERGHRQMATRTKSYVTPKYKTKYKVRNWPAYEASLRKRGDVTVWFQATSL